MSLKQRRITIFIHGTLPPAPLLKIPVVEAFFHVPRGLTKATEVEEKYHTSKIAHLLINHESVNFSKEHFYLFGWSGKLRFAARKEAAADLFNHLYMLKKQHESENIKLHITLITHSHGGNVALSLVPLAQENPEKKVTINELILLACPVQVETEAHVHDSLFTQVFSLYSHHDILQVLDPQGIHLFTESLKHYGLEFTVKHLKQLGPLFSARRFKASPKVTQLNVRHTNRELFHMEFLLPSTINALPDLINQMKAHAASSKGDQHLVHVLSGKD